MCMILLSYDLFLVYDKYSLNQILLEYIIMDQLSFLHVYAIEMYRLTRPLPLGAYVLNGSPLRIDTINTPQNKTLYVLYCAVFNLNGHI